MSSTGPTASYTRCSMRVPAGRSCRSSQNVIPSRSGTNLRWRGQRRNRSDRRQKFLAGTYRFECLPEGEEGPLVLGYEHSEIQRRNDTAEQGEIVSGSSLAWRARWSSAICSEPARKAVAYWLTNSCASNERCPGAQDQHQCVVASQSS